MKQQSQQMPYGHEVLDDEHVGEGVDLGGLGGIGVNLAATGVRT